MKKYNKLIPLIADRIRDYVNEKPQNAPNGLTFEFVKYYIKEIDYCYDYHFIVKTLTFSRDSFRQCAITDMQEIQMTDIN